MTIAECINVLLIIEDYFKEDFTEEEKKALGMAIEILVTLDRERITIPDPPVGLERFQKIKNATTPPPTDTTKNKIEFILRKSF